MVLPVVEVDFNFMPKPNTTVGQYPGLKVGDKVLLRDSGVPEMALGTVEALFGNDHFEASYQWGG